jgi:hypothetical protein
LADAKVFSGSTSVNKTAEGPCLMDNWNAYGSSHDLLICSTKDVSLSSLTSSKPLTCAPGDSLTISVDASIMVTKSINDLGWYIATDGIDALEGTCVTNGLQQGNAYAVLGSQDSSKTVGSVYWDGSDECGDVDVGSAGVINTPFAHQVTVPCTDENENGILDFAVCFTWRTADNAQCVFDKNTPATAVGGCYCRRYDVSNITVTPANAQGDVKPCH